MKLELHDRPVLLFRGTLPDSIEEFFGVEEGDDDTDTIDDREGEFDFNRFMEREFSQEAIEREVEAMLPIGVHVQTGEEMFTIVSEEELYNIKENKSIKGSTGELLRLLRISYSHPSERNKIFHWLSLQSEVLPFVHGIGSTDILLLPAKNILEYMNGLESLL